MERISQEKYLEIINKFKEENKEDYENSKIRKVFLDILPHGGKGKKGGNISNKCINWDYSKNFKIYFIYKDREGYIKIIDYERDKKNYILIEFNDKEDEVFTCDFQRCKIGKILGKATGDFKIEIGMIFKDNKRNITITDAKKDEKGLKYYKYKCNECGFECGEHYSTRDKIYKEEYWITEGNLKDGKGCSCCCSSSHIVVKNINSIVITDPWMIPYFQGGYEEAKKYTARSNENIIPLCPDCGKVKSKKMRINTIYEHHSIACICSDKFPYPEKFVFSILIQLGLDFETQLNKSSFNWCKKYKYDFYFEYNNEQYIVETHGMQHYEEGFTHLKDSRMLKEEQENDRLKKELALANGIKEENYIVIDCRKSTLEWINNSILNNEKMITKFDLSNIDWIQCSEFACINLVKKVCEIKHDNCEMTTTDIGNILNIKGQTARKYLKQGSEIWDWINYDAKEEMEKALGKKVEIFKDGISLGVFKSIIELERRSLEIFGVKLFNANIGKVCQGISGHHHGFTFKYIDSEIY